jgi:predicted transposase/invertase (TIGR01784 family)
MGEKDIVTKEIIKEIGQDIALYILGIDIDGEVELVDKEWTRIEKRESDIVFKYEKKIVHIEIQNDNHPMMEFRMLRYLSDILFEYKGYEVSQHLIYIGQKKCRMKKRIEQNKLSYSYDIIDVRDISCEELLYHEHPSAVALSILCDFKGKDRQMVVNTILKRIRKLTKEDDREYQNYLEKVTILSTNRDLEENVKEGAKMLAVDIEKIPFYQDGLKKGLEKGVQLVAVQMLKLNIDVEIIRKSTGLSIVQIEELRREV